MMAFWLLLKGLPWRLIGYCAAALVAVGLFMLVMHWKHNSDKLPAVEAERDAEIACADHTACAKRYAQYQEDGVAAVIAARQAAAEAAGKARAKLAADAQAAVQRAEAAANVARVRQREAEARLKASIASDESCAAQSREVILCDY